MRLRNTNDWVKAIVAIFVGVPLAFALIGEFIGAVFGTLGDFAHDSWSELVAVFGAWAVLIATVLLVLGCLFMWLDRRSPSHRRKHFKSRHRNRNHWWD